MMAVMMAVLQCAGHFSGALAIFLAFGYLVSPRPSERDGLSNSERRSVDLGAFYLNSSPSLMAK